jgi:predicted NAD/FAD-binding protein
MLQNPSMKHLNNPRIAVIGGGIAGLSAAEALKELGYSRVVVFEAQPDVGGKISSFKHHGETFELGALCVCGTDKAILKLLRKHGVRTAPGTRDLKAVGEKYQGSLSGYWIKCYGLASVLLSAVSFVWTLLRYGRFERRFDEAHPNLHLPLHRFARQHGIEPITGAVAPFITVCGYGHPEQVPALYLMRFIKECISIGIWQALDDLMGISVRTTRFFPDGYQGLLRAMASKLDVRTGHHVARVLREKNDRGDWCVRVTACDKTEVFDQVIVASPLDVANKFLDATPEENELFSRLHTYRYIVTVLEAEGIEKQSRLVFVDHTTPQTMGRVQCVCSGKGRLLTTYQLVRPDQDDKTLDRFLREDIQKLGGDVRRIIARREWSYFPHVSCDALRDNYYQRIDRLQGVRGTFYVGGALSFEKTNDIVGFSQELVRRFF